MNTEQKKIEKTQVFNVVIIDRSGSMDCLRRAAVSGFNETLQTIRSAQQKYSEDQEHFVTLVTFSTEGMDTVYDNAPIRSVKELKMKDYYPCGGTPLYDAMGFTINKMAQKVDAIEDSTVFFTIITDGLENSSMEFNGATIRALVEKSRAKGWSFTYMGANQDAIKVSMELSIRNSRNFSYDECGTRGAMNKDSSTRMNFFSRLHQFKEMEKEQQVNLSSECRRHRYADIADEAFDEEERK